MSLEAGYAHALYELQKGQGLSADAAVSKLMKVLKGKGHVKLLPRIVAEFEKILDMGRNEDTITMTCAKEQDFKKYGEELKEHLGTTGSDFTKEVVDDTIIGGFILQKGEIIIDGSYKKKLLLLYQNAIA
jgi:F0F1-type ATP synthase delta subunit